VQQLRLARAAGFAALAMLGALPACGDNRPTCPAATYPGTIPTPAVSTTIPLSERLSARSEPDGSGIVIDITDDRGTISFAGRGPIPAFIYRGNRWGTTNQTVYAGIGITASAWHPFYLYCDPAGRLTEFYGEMTDRTEAVYATVTGSCTVTEENWDLPVDVPAGNLDNVALACGFEVHRPSSDLPLDLVASRPGRMPFEGQFADVFVFSTVDCRGGCGEAHGWFELHSIITDSHSKELGFVIWYLYPDDRAQGVVVANSIFFPSGAPLTTSFPGAVWSLTI
jgi:hypothetical protein